MQIEVDPKKNSSTQPLVPFSSDLSVAAAAGGTDTDMPGAAASQQPAIPAAAAGRPAGSRREIGGPAGPEPTRFGDWERKGRCIDF